MRTVRRVRMAQRIAHGLGGDAQQLVLALGHEAVANHGAFEAAGGAAFDGGALGELAQRELEADALGLVGAQRHHRAARIGEALARQVGECA